MRAPISPPPCRNVKLEWLGEGCIIDWRRTGSPWAADCQRFLLVRLLLLRAVLRLGTFAPLLRASLSPIAIACFRLLTVPPDPLFNVPRFRRRIADSTVFDAFLPYFAMSTSDVAESHGAGWVPSHSVQAKSHFGQLPVTPPPTRGRQRPGPSSSPRKHSPRQRGTSRATEETAHEHRAW